MQSNNLQYAFYVEYYQDLPKFLKEIDRFEERKKMGRLRKNEKSPEIQHYKRKNSEILNIAKNSTEKMQTLTKYDNYRNDKDKLSTWELHSTYPGVLIGIGHIHGVNKKGEIGMGFTFDYVTGMPYLPGSTLKGLLRHGFSQTEYIQNLIKDLADITLSEKEIIEFEEILFEGKDQIQRAIFYDVIVSAPRNKNLLALDVIAPHSKDGLQEPNPITFLRIGPGVTFHFELQLYDIILTKEKKICKDTVEKICKSILINLGIGAKTNVGYGVLEK